MARHVISMSLLAVTVSAQASFASSGFEYVGCVEANPQVFDLNIDFFEAFTPQDCQAACAGKASFAAIGSGCRCDVPHLETEVSFRVVEEAACSVRCVPDNPDAGQCGGESNSEGSDIQVFNLYRKSGTGPDSDDCHEGEEEAALNKAAAVPVVVETIISCSAEKADCPLHAAEKLALPCPPEGCEPKPAVAPIAAPLPTPTPELCPPGGCPPVYNKVPLACPSEGCRHCPPEGCEPCAEAVCLPACPEGCIAPPPAPAPTPIRIPICPGGDCDAPTTLTPRPLIATDEPISPPPPPSEPETESRPEPEPETSELPAANAGRKGSGVTVEMLTMVCAAIVLLAF